MNKSNSAVPQPWSEPSAPLSPLPSPASGVTTRLPIPQQASANRQRSEHVPAPAKHTETLEAYKRVVSAACYLSLGPSEDLDSSLEAVQILHDLSQQLQAEGLGPARDLGGSEDTIWQQAQEKWERRIRAQTAANGEGHGKDEHRILARLTRLLSPRTATQAARLQAQRKEGMLFCNDCEDYLLRRVGRIGFWQTKIASRLGLYPWECMQCRKISLFNKRAQEGRKARRSAPRELDLIPASHYMSKDRS